MLRKHILVSYKAIIAFKMIPLFVLRNIDPKKDCNKTKSSSPKTERTLKCET